MMTSFNWQLVTLLAFGSCTAKVTSQVPPTTDSLQLTGNLGIQNTYNGFLEDSAGNRYDLSMLSPYTDLLSPNRFVPLDGGSKQVAPTSNEVFKMPIYRAVYENGTILQAEKDENGVILSAEIRGNESTPATYFVKTVECQHNELLVFDETQVDESASDGFEFGDVEMPDLPLSTTPVESSRAALPSFVYTRGDGSSNECVFFKVVKIGIVYDAEFCRKYGGNSGARSRIMMIVATASLLYENDMCVKLQLVDIYTPDVDCSAVSTFDFMPRNRACGSGNNSNTFIRFFRDWMNENRDSIGLDPEATFHGFTGFPPQGTLGCAYIGTVCRAPQFAYGVDYMSSNVLSTQSIILAHELGHNLNARHLSTSDSVGLRYIMKPTLQNPNVGFSPMSIGSIMAWLDSNEVTCDVVLFRERPTDKTTDAPTSRPAPLPTLQPTASPSRTPTRIPSLLPSRVPSVQPSPTPSQLPSPLASIRDFPTHPGCALEQAASIDSPCVFEAMTPGHFGCFELESLMAVQPNDSCSLENPIVADLSFRSCQERQTVDDQEISNDEDRRQLKRKKQKSETSIDDRADTYEYADWLGTVDGPLGPELVTTRSGSNDVMDEQGLDSFVAPQGQACTATGCTRVNDYVCVSADLEIGETKRTYVVAFTASLGGKTVLLTTDVAVQQREAGDGSNDFQIAANPTCVRASTICLEQ